MFEVFRLLRDVIVWCDAARKVLSGLSRADSCSATLAADFA
jgi:hypothetical protein